MIDVAAIKAEVELCLSINNKPARESPRVVDSEPNCCSDLTNTYGSVQYSEYKDRTESWVGYVPLTRMELERPLLFRKP